MSNNKTIHIVPREGRWAVLTDDTNCIKDGLATREEAIKLAGQVAGEGKFAFMMIHSKDDLRPRNAA